MTIHVSTVGTYHPAPFEDWTINEFSGAPSCIKCKRCDCPSCESNRLGFICKELDCMGLSFAYVNIHDDSESLCESCATKAGIKIVDCDCS